jgi:hypothetical protein
LGLDGDELRQSVSVEGITVRHSEIIKSRGGTVNNSSKSIKVELPTGEVIWARATVDGPKNVASNPLHHLDMEDFRRTVRGLSSTLRNAVDDLVPDETQVEFGLELEVKSGKLVSVLAEAGATATVKVALTWKRAAESTGAPGPLAAVSE